MLLCGFLITSHIILIIHPALHPLSPPPSFLSFIPLCLTCRWLAWMGLEDKGRRGSSYILVTRCQISGAQREKKRAQHLLGKYIPSPRSPALEAVAKKSSRPFKQHKTSNYARQKQSIWWTFLAFQICSFMRFWILNWKRFCFVSFPSPASRHHLVTLQDALN